MNSDESNSPSDTPMPSINVESTQQTLIVAPTVDMQVREFERGLLAFLQGLGLPTADIFTEVEERLDVFKNLASVLSRVVPEHLERSIYISRFIAAVASGLFDAALNYLWDETVSELRRRVCQYDLSYFFDNAVGNSDKRKGLATEDDLAKIDDRELVHGAKEIGLISENGYRHLDLIRYYRNAASAAHPNRNELTGLQLVAWLQTCIKEVIELPLSANVVGVRQLLANVKTTTITPDQAQGISLFFLEVAQEQANSLASGFFGIYTRADTTSQVQQNIRLLLPQLWVRVDEQTRGGFGIKYSRFVANNEQPAQKLAREFLETVTALSYIPKSLLAAEIDRALESLLTSHHNYNNFHNEPPFARALSELIGRTGASIPPQVRTRYVHVLVMVYTGNGYGVSNAAEAYYLDLLNRFDADQALIAILSFTNAEIASHLQPSLTAQRYRDLLKLMSPKVTSPVVKDLLTAIENYRAPLHVMKDDQRIKSRLVPLETILGSQGASGR